MFRQPIVPWVYLMFGLGLAGLVAPTPAAGQDRSTQERLDRLERDLNMLQRQVYRGGPPPMPGDAGGAVNAQLRMDRLEGEMRELTGRVEEFANQVEQIRQRLEQVNGDVETRTSQGGPVNGGPGAGQLAAVGPPPPPRRPPPPPVAAAPRGYPPSPPSALPQEPNEEDLGPPSFGGPSGKMRPLGIGPAPPGGALGLAPGPSYGTLTPPGTPPGSPPGPPPGPPPGAASSAPELASAAPSGRALPSGSATEQYNYAFGLLKQADYPAAETALKSFVEQHPRDAMAGNAQYWLGETYYARNKFMEAAAAFAEGYRRYPKGPKAADDLLKLGMSLARANQKPNACVALAQLDHDFPNPGASIKARAAEEKKRLGC